MALYESVCPRCNTIYVYRSSIDERDKAPVCKVPECKEQQTLRKMITPPMGTVIGPAAG